MVQGPMSVAVTAVEGQTCLQDRARTSEVEKEPAENAGIS